MIDLSNVLREPRFSKEQIWEMYPFFNGREDIVDMIYGDCPSYYLKDMKDMGYDDLSVYAVDQSSAYYMGFFGSGWMSENGTVYGCHINIKHGVNNVLYLYNNYYYRGFRILFISVGGSEKCREFAVGDCKKDEDHLPYDIDTVLKILSPKKYDGLFVKQSKIQALKILQEHINEDSMLLSKYGKIL